jgi:hypothetical protein
MHDYDEMRTFQFGEEHPGYRRELAPITPTAEDILDPDWHEAWLAAQEHTDAENASIWKSNNRTEVARLRGILAAHGIDPDQDEEG